ncbi:MAG: ATPase, T2SS/T4P/T4SS family [Chthoniobacteraceae bacterium]|nr:ATPase, T2SS/T4P/T4SS family [Chthoniobacteraceae bacterium]
MTNNDDYIIELLLDTCLITKEQLEEAKAEAKPGQSPVEVLITKEVVNRNDVLRALAAHSSMEYVDLSQMAISQEVLDVVPVDVARRYKVIPLANVEMGLMMATSDPLNFDTFDTVTHLIGRDVEWVCAAPEQIQAALQKYYGVDEQAAGSDIQIGDVSAATEESDAPIIKLVTMLLMDAYKMRASDIHLEPLEKSFRVRFRVDGVLIEMPSPPKKLQQAIVSRLKIMSGSMSIAEKRLPQDGRIQVKIGKSQLDLRVSTIPTNHGESVVMRILDKTGLQLGLPQLGFLSDDQATFEQLITLPDGIILVTGPTGSGKSTTLYACLNHINRPDRKIITVEDPVEYQMNGINQVQVNSEIGMTFPAALRSMLRQAPNVIMIGEIRDMETASIAINASLTGHLVFSTLHTNDAPSAVARLVDIGVQRFLVSSAVRAIVAQRLVRKLCPKCKKPHELTDAELRGLHLERTQLEGATVMRGVGCDACRNLGYKGRLGIFEIFLIDDEVRNMINDGASTIDLRRRARELGMRTLREDGVRKVLAGVTSADEVISATMSDAN